MTTTKTSSTPRPDTPRCSGRPGTWMSGTGTARAGRDRQVTCVYTNRSRCHGGMRRGHGRSTSRSWIPTAVPVRSVDATSSDRPHTPGPALTAVDPSPPARRRVSPSPHRSVAPHDGSSCSDPAASSPRARTPPRRRLRPRRDPIPRSSIRGVRRRHRVARATTSARCTNRRASQSRCCGSRSTTFARSRRSRRPAMVHPGWSAGSSASIRTGRTGSR